MQRVLLIDGLNNFIRNYVVMPHISSHGDPIGGIAGFLLGLQLQCTSMRPTEIVVVWDGAGGSLRRKQTNSGYKDGRSPVRLNRSFGQHTQEEQDNNRAWQQVKLIEILNTFPVIQFMYDSVEADDIIAMLVRHRKYADYQKVIVSSDKDFFQLLDSKTVIYRPVQKQYVNKNNVIEEHGIHPNNFAIARAIAGDSSDNLPGVKGAGLPTIAKRLPFLAEEKQYLLDDVVEYCKNSESKVKFYSSLLDSQKVVESNYSIMQLDAPMIPFAESKKIDSILQSFNPQFNATEARKQMLKEGFGSMNFENLFANFNKIVKVHSEE